MSAGTQVIKDSKLTSACAGMRRRVHGKPVLDNGKRTVLDDDNDDEDDDDDDDDEKGRGEHGQESG